MILSKRKEKYEKIVIRKENTTNPNVKKKPKKYKAKKN